MVDIMYQNALAEVEEILQNTEEELVAKIPNKIRQFIKENRNQEYMTNIVNAEPLNRQSILPETQALLALIYRSYWATEEEKKEFADRDSIELKKEEVKQSLYSSNVFEKQKMTDEIEVKPKEITDIVLVQEEKWYQKVWRKLCSLFRK
ncbi:MAG: hypothetical protein HFJ30_04335 [Clostridia bacterium]|jgi:hypothetical protein|nr:hypothetical protein [Clostridia bacterium]MCI9413261.1 hypothetical protein [Clostridia bacterium]